MAQQNETLVSPEKSNRPWSVVGVDLFRSPDSEDQYLITVDDYSNFEIDRLEDTRSAAVISKLKQHFARHEIPDKVISDNGPHLSPSSLMTSNSSGNSTIGHLTLDIQIKRETENAVKSAKQLMKKAKHSGQKPWLAVLDFRNTPS